MTSPAGYPGRPPEIAGTPEPPYYAVIFTSRRASEHEGYSEMADRMEELAREQPGFLGVESVREGDMGITVSYWDSPDAIERWRKHVEHREAQRLGRSNWYDEYAVRMARVERGRTFVRVRGRDFEGVEGV
ncbi:MAG: antibiotic biosynthesis monooxygenase [Gemmatimonadetes bacterium]|nr:antibiotic biosynthesis monooxygenase [Gemmatimonadota bacterium]